jgi:short-subunit dehydrogenase
MSNRVRAVVTGASSGLGVEFCRQLADCCDEIVLVARTESALVELAKELEFNDVEAHIVVADLTKMIDLTRVVETIRQKGPFQYLINNAGFSTLGPFVKQQPQLQHDMVALHITAAIELCSAALGGMIEQGKGVVVNVSSLTALLPMAQVAVYGGTKAFLNNYSEALQSEVAKQGIKIQSLCPGYIRTAFHATDSFAGFDVSRVPDEMWMEAKDVVAESLAALSSGPVVYVAGEYNRNLLATMTK